MTDKMKSLMILTGLLVFFIPITALASPLTTNNGPSMNEQLGIWTEGVNSLAPQMSLGISSIFTIMFLFGAARLGYSIVTKTGQVMKGATGLLIWVPISFFAIRVLILFLFTTETKGVTLLASDMIRLLSAVSYSTVDWMLSIGLLFYLFFNLIRHPEFGRWSKRMWVVAAVLTLLTIVAPIVLGVV